MLFLLLNLFETASSHDTSPPDPSVVQECANRIGDECGDKMLMYIFIQKTSVSVECCGKLLSYGRDCHNTLTESLLATNRFNNKQPQIMERHNELWTKCEQDGQIE